MSGWEMAHLKTGLNVHHLVFAIFLGLCNPDFEWLGHFGCHLGFLPFDNQVQILNGQLLDPLCIASSKNIWSSEDLLKMSVESYLTKTCLRHLQLILS